MVHWRNLWEQLQVERAGPRSEWDPLIEQSNFLIDCVRNVSSTTNLEALILSIIEVQREIDTRQRLDAARAMMTTFLAGMPPGTRIDSDGLLEELLLTHGRNQWAQHPESGTSQLTPVLSVPHFRGLLARNVVYNTTQPTRLVESFQTLSENLHDRSWLRNPGFEYHELMQGTVVSELPQYHDVLHRKLRKSYSEDVTEPIKFNPPLQQSTLQEARRRRNTALTHSDSTISIDLPPQYPWTLSPEKIGILSSRFVIDPRSRHSSYGAQQIGVLRSATWAQRCRGERRSDPDGDEPLTAQDIEWAKTSEEPRRSLPYLLEAGEVDYSTLPANIMQVELSDNRSLFNHSLATGGLQTNLPIRERHASMESNRSLPSTDLCGDFGVSIITNTECESASSPAFSWAESIPIDVDSMSESSPQPVASQSQEYDFGCTHPPGSSNDPLGEAISQLEKHWSSRFGPAKSSALSCETPESSPRGISMQTPTSASWKVEIKIVVDADGKSSHSSEKDNLEHNVGDHVMHDTDHATDCPKDCQDGGSVSHTLPQYPEQDQNVFLIAPASSWNEGSNMDLSKELNDEDAANDPTLSPPASQLIPRASRKRLFNRVKNYLQWPRWFINSRGNEYFCDVDEEYLTDRFNLTGLNTEVQYYQYALDLITDVFDLDCEDEMREQIEKSARHLYGLVHARYIATTRGQQKMMEKFKTGDFGKCPRVACDGQSLLPMGQHDVAAMSTVKLYCARCEDLYNPKSSRHAAIDGAYFGTSFHNIFFQMYPHMQPPKSQRRYEPRIYGFKVHASAALARWQTEQREKMKERLKAEGLETGFEEEEREDEMDDSEGEDEGQDGIDDMFEGQRAGAPVKR